MSETIKKIDEKFQETIKPFHSYLTFKMRDETGYTPYKIRTVLFVETEEGMHYTETEQFTDLKEYEEMYQEYVSRDVVRQAKDIIENTKKGKE